MISPAFYTKKSLVRQLASGKALHYPQKPLSLAVKTRPYVVQFGDTYYSLARTLFGEDRQYLWPIIADINPPTYPDELEAGLTIQLPVVVVQDNYTV